MHLKSELENEIKKNNEKITEFARSLSDLKDIGYKLRWSADIFKASAKNEIYIRTVMYMNSKNYKGVASIVTRLQQECVGISSQLHTGNGMRTVVDTYTVNAYNEIISLVETYL